MIGIFGGTFDPVHYGHLRAAHEANEALGLREMRLLPAGTPPHRSNTFAAAEHRLAMLRMAVAAYADLRTDDREVRRQGYSYMVDTLQEIRQEEGDVPLLLFIGQDAANKLDSWHRWEELFLLAHIVIMRRPDSRHEYSGALFREIQERSISTPPALRNSRAGRVLPLEVTQLDISSTMIREQVGAGLSPRFLTPDAVIDYIAAHGLYR